MRRILFLSVLLGLPLPAFAQALPATSIDIPRVEAAPKLDDYLPGGSMPGLKVTDFRQREPKDLEPGSQPTAAYLAYDALHIYAAFVCTQPRELLRARMQKRENIGSDDLVGIYLDTFFDKQRAYLFYASPLGIQADGIITENNGEDFSFDTEFEAKGKITDAGYVVLITVPFKSVRFPVTADGRQRWGLALVRSVRSANETDFWPGNTSRVNGFIAQFATATGVANVSPGRNFQFIPYGTFTGARFLDSGASAYVRKNEGRAGMDVKLVPRDAVTLDFTINPDFSQVESDEPQVTVNQRFEVFFPEKRPFFLENSDFFSAPTTLLFSRRIRDPQFGARMTGKFGDWSTGALVMDDRAPGHAVDPSSRAFNQRAVSLVGTARRNFSNQSTVGFFATSRHFGDSSNHVGELSTHVRLNKNWFIDAEAVGSHNTTLDGVKTDGSAMFLGVNRSGRALTYSINYNGISPNFRVPLGFIPRTDIHDVISFLSYRWHPKAGSVTSWGPNSYIEGTWNYRGELQDYIFRFPIFVQFRRQTSVFVRHAVISETIGGMKLGQREELVQFNSSYLRWLETNASISFGTRPNYYPSAGVAPFLGNFQDWNMGVTIKPISRLSVGETILWSRLAGREATPASGANIFDNAILRTRLNYQFSREWSLRAILDYNSLDPNPSVVGFERGRHFGADILLTWLPHPGTALYVGYTDGYDNLRLDPGKRVFTTDGELHSTGRQLFIKSSWLLRF
ncbi:MAG: hypothetical protein EPO35_11820 [Acidobacteria bacterium]|nr:MAG: hypothetical protein EPO35_11820 [Acidobacteriota bacterium]